MHVAQHNPVPKCFVLDESVRLSRHGIHSPPFKAGLGRSSLFQPQPQQQQQRPQQQQPQQQQQQQQQLNQVAAGVSVNGSTQGLVQPNKMVYQQLPDGNIQVYQLAAGLVPVLMPNLPPASAAPAMPPSSVVTAPVPTQPVPTIAQPDLSKQQQQQQQGLSVPEQNEIGSGAGAVVTGSQSLPPPMQEPLPHVSLPTASATAKEDQQDSKEFLGSVPPPPSPQPPPDQRMQDPIIVVSQPEVAGPSSDSHSPVPPSQPQEHQQGKSGQQHSLQPVSAGVFVPPGSMDLGLCDSYQHPQLPAQKHSLVYPSHLHRHLQKDWSPYQHPFMTGGCLQRKSSLPHPNLNIFEHYSEHRSWTEVRRGSLPLMKEDQVHHHQVQVLAAVGTVMIQGKDSLSETAFRCGPSPQAPQHHSSLGCSMIPAAEPNFTQSQYCLPQLPEESR